MIENKFNFIFKNETINFQTDEEKSDETQAIEKYDETAERLLSFPEELMVLIFSHLRTSQELGTVSLVCKKWCLIVEGANQLWKPFREEAERKLREINQADCPMLLEIEKHISETAYQLLLERIKESGGTLKIKKVKRKEKRDFIIAKKNLAAALEEDKNSRFGLEDARRDFELSPTSAAYLRQWKSDKQPTVRNWFCIVQ